MFFKKRNKQKETMADETNDKVQPKSKAEMINMALEFVLKYENRVAKERLMTRLPGLSEEEIADLEAHSREVRDSTIKTMKRLYRYEICDEEAKRRTLARYPFLSDENYKRLHNRGMHEAWREYGDRMDSDI